MYLRRVLKFVTKKNIYVPNTSVFINTCEQKYFLPKRSQADHDETYSINLLEYEGVSYLLCVVWSNLEYGWLVNSFRLANKEVIFYLFIFFFGQSK